MLKPVDDSVKILETKLIKKTGGINVKPENHNYNAAVIVISDASSKGEREDKSGPAAKDFLQGLGFNVSEIIIIPDDTEKIQENIINLCDAILSNSVAGVRDKTLIIALPGSPKGVQESLFALKTSILHAIKMIKGEKH